MEGFFVVVDCSKVLNYSKGISYKIFIDKSQMSIVYELKEWIRFMFDLKNCFFFIHDNSVIHELEDIQVLEILKVLELQPCVQPNCLHKKLEKNLLSKLNLFTYWNDVKVHKLFIARQNGVIPKIPHNQEIHSNFNEKCIKSCGNINEQTNKSVAINTNQSVTSPFKLTHNNNNENEVIKDKLTYKNQLDVKDRNLTGDDKNISSDGIKTPNLLQMSNSDNSNLHTESITLSPANKKPKLQFEPKQNTTIKKNTRRIIPFSLGALLSDIREQAQNQGSKEKDKTDKVEESDDLACPDNENENMNSPSENVSPHSDSLGKKRRRRRKHKKQNLKLDLQPPSTSKTFDIPWNFKEVSFSSKPNHIRFSDTEEFMETETIDKSVELNCVKSLNNEMQPIPSVQLTPEPTPLVEEDESKKDCSAIIKSNHEVSEELVNENSEGHNYTNLSDSGIEKKEFNDTQNNLSALESLRQKIMNPEIFSRFY